MVVVEEIMQLFDVSYSSLVFQDVVVKCGLVNEFDIVLLNLILPAQFDRKLVKWQMNDTSSTTTRMTQHCASHMNDTSSTTLRLEHIVHKNTKYITTP